MALITRRNAVLSGLAVVAGSGGAQLFSPAVLASDADLSSDLMSAPSLGENWIGDKHAPVTMIEYASPACSHCAEFHANVFPTLKRDYIDTGNMRFAIREFPIDEPSLAAFMLARCAPGNGYYGMVEALFQQQKTWAHDNPKADLLLIAQKAGFTEEGFETCLQDNTIANGILETRNHASLKLGVEATPTFFINGQKISGSHPVHYFQKMLDALIG